MGPIVYLGLGSNIGNRIAALKQACSLILAIPEVINFKVSSFYETSPISDIPQSDYINIVCCFETILDLQSLWILIQKIEKTLGKSPKSKNAPRLIDIDILFFGDEKYMNSELEIPHPRWNERLFVVIPLLELTSTINIGEEMINLLTLKNSILKQQDQFVFKLGHVIN